MNTILNKTMQLQPKLIRLLPLVLVLPALVLMSSTRLSSQSESFFTHTGEDGKVESLEAYMHSSQVQGMSLVVFRELEEDTLITLGYRDAEQKAPVDENTLFNAGSMSASLYNFAVLRAASEGKIDLDAPVQNYLQSWQFESRGWMKKNPVTARGLLLSQYKLSTGYKSEGQITGGELPNLSTILNGEAEGPRLEVKGKAKKPNYSYGNHLLLRLLLEEVYGQPIETVVQEQVLQPLGMTQSRFTPSLAASDTGNASLGYRQDGARIEGGRYDYPLMCSGGLWSTPREYARFVAHIFRAAKGEDNSLISQELAQQAITPQNDSRCLIFNKGYDLYWGGASQGFYTTFGGKPENGTIVVVFTNSDINWKFTNQVAGMGWAYSRRKHN